MTERMTVYEGLRQRGVSRRGFLKLCAYTSSILALPAGAARVMAQAMENNPRPSVIWLSFQECTGCTESFTRSFVGTLEDLILNQISLDYHHTLQAASGEAAEKSRTDAMEQFWGEYVVIVDGSVPLRDDGIYSTIAGQTNVEMLQEVAEGAAVILSIGNCAAYGGVAAANPNPTTAVGVDEVPGIDVSKVINVPGCPPVPEVISGTIAYYLTYGSLPELDGIRRPLVFFGGLDENGNELDETVHSNCPRRVHFFNEEFALSFDDEGARQGWCLRLLGCAGTVTRNACTKTKWNQGVSFPMFSGHGCLGCSEPGFWDRQGGLYGPVQLPI